MIIPFGFMAESGASKDPNDEFVNGDVCSPFSEANDVTAWDATGGQNSTSASSTDSYDGTWSIEVTATADNFARKGWEFTGVASDTFTLTFRAKRGSQGTNQYISVTNATGDISQSISTTSWDEYIMNFTVTSSAAVQVRIRAIDTTGGAIGDKILVDKLTCINTT